MPNMLNDLFPSLYDAMHVVSREMTGMVMAVEKSAKNEMAAIDQPVRVPVVQAMESQTITPGNISPTGEERDIDNVQVTITKHKKASFHLTGEDTMKLNSSGTLSDITQQSMQQAFRVLVNEIETDLCGLYSDAGLAYGTPGTSPFQTVDNLEALANVTRYLNLRGAPQSMRSIILNDDHRAALEGRQSTIFKVNEAGEFIGRRQGAMGMIFGLDIGHSIQFPTHAANANYAGAINNAQGENKGDRSLTVDGSTRVALKKGDLIDIADVTGHHVVSGTVAANANQLPINGGLLTAADDNAAVTDTAAAAYKPSMAFTRDAIALACRLPAVPEGGDMAVQREAFTDPISGLSFSIAEYKQYYQSSIEVAIAWGVATIKPEHIVLLVS